MTEIKNVFTTPDGKQFDTKAEAVNHLRLPKIREAFAKLTDNNTELAEWLIANQEQVEMAFETGTIRRVSKAEKKKLQASLDAIRKLAIRSLLSLLTIWKPSIRASVGRLSLV